MCIEGREEGLLTSNRVSMLFSLYHTVKQSLIDERPAPCMVGDIFWRTEIQKERKHKRCGWW
jgi:hypothetical protein